MNRDEIASCPRCGAGLEVNVTRLVCGQCNGVLVPEAEVRAMIAEAMSFRAAPAGEPAELSLDAPPGAEPPLTCPSCMTQMTKHALHGITIDRCVAHGIWFDGQELQSVLSEAGFTDLKKARTLSVGQKVGGGLVVGAYLALQVIRFLYF